MRAALAVAILGLVAQAFGPAAAAPATPASHVVRVDVMASDARGRTIENLKPSDFQLTEDASPQTIDDLRFVRIDAKPGTDAALTPIRSEFDEQEEASRDGARLFAMLLDEYHVSPGANTDRVREELTRFVDRDLGPHDLVAVVKPLDSLLTIRVTRDRDLLRHAIETFAGRKGDYEPRNPFERNYIAGAPARIEQVRTQVATSALNALVVHLGKLNDRRKAVLLVSEGLGRPSRRRGVEGLPTVDSVVRSANRYNVSIYAVDPQAAEGASDGDRQEEGEGAAADVDTLRALASATDGHATIDAGGWDEALRLMVSDSSAYYLLSYRSTGPSDGKFREIQVRVKRPGVRVRARKGYWGLWPDEVLAAEMLARGNEPARAALPAAFALPWRTSPLIRPWFGLARGENGKTRVSFVWEPAPRVPGDRTRVAPASRVMLKAFAPDGTQLFEGAIVAAGAAGEPCSAGPPACDSARAVFDVPPGRVRLSMSIQDAGEQAIDSDVREISVRELKGPVALGTAEILRTRTAREFREVGADPRAVPVASREFSRTERLIVRFHAYAPDGVAPHVAVRLVNRIGQTLRDLPVEAPATPGGVYQADVLLASLAPSEYFFELSASSAAGEAKDLIGFRVTN